MNMAGDLKFMIMMNGGWLVACNRADSEERWLSMKSFAMLWFILLRSFCLTRVLYLLLILFHVAFF